jgi:hypothetical protein
MGKEGAGLILKPKSRTLKPKSRTWKDYQYCFYGHEFKKEKVGDEENEKIKEALSLFLKYYEMKICPLVEAGDWLWPELVEGMERSAFCVFETKSQNRNVHIELGYALAKNLNVILLVPDNDEKPDDYREYLPSDLAGLVQIRYKRHEELGKKFEKEIPKRYVSVKDRLRISFQSVTDIDCAYFQILLRANTKIKFSELVGIAGIRNSASSNTYLAAFLRKYDEVLVPYSKCELDSARLRIDEEYKKWICQRLGRQASHRSCGDRSLS